MASARAADAASFFAVDPAAGLQAGGRLGPAADVPTLVSRPLLALHGGQLQLLERVRTRSAAVRRLAQLAAEFAAGRATDFAVQHTGCPDRAAALLDLLLAEIARPRSLGVLPASPVIWSHTGAGTVGVALAPAVPGG